jgi:hypothetical protein
VKLSGGALDVGLSSGSGAELTLQDKTSYGEIQTFNGKPLLLNDQGNNVGVGASTTPGTLFSIGATASGINFSLSTSTFENAGGINLTTGCFAINANCLSLSTLPGIVPVVSGGTATTSLGVTNGVLYNNGSNWTNANTFTFNGTNVGIASSTPWSMLSVGPNGAITTTEASSTWTSTINVNWKNGNQQKFEMNGNTTVQQGFNTIPGQTERIILCQDGTGSRTVTWGLSSSSIIWAGGTAPTQTATAYACDIYSFLVTGATSTVVTFGATSQNFP